MSHSSLSVPGILSIVSGETRPRAPVWSQALWEDEGEEPWGPNEGISYVIFYVSTWVYFEIVCVSTTFTFPLPTWNCNPSFILYSYFVQRIRCISMWSNIFQIPELELQFDCKDSSAGIVWPNLVPYRPRSVTSQGVGGGGMWGKTTNQFPICQYLGQTRHFGSNWVLLNWMESTRLRIWGISTKI